MPLHNFLYNFTQKCQREETRHPLMDAKADRIPSISFHHYYTIIDCSVYEVIYIYTCIYTRHHSLI